MASKDMQQRKLQLHTTLTPVHTHLQVLCALAKYTQVQFCMCYPQQITIHVCAKSRQAICVGQYCWCSICLLRRCCWCAVTRGWKVRRTWTRPCRCLLSCAAQRAPPTWRQRPSSATRAGEDPGCPSPARGAPPSPALPKRGVAHPQLGAGGGPLWLL